MPAHIPFYDNKNNAIVDSNNHMVARSYFNRVLLKKDEVYTHDIPGYESGITLGKGTCTITVTATAQRNSAVDTVEFTEVGTRTYLFDGKPDSVYVPLHTSAHVKCVSQECELYIAGGKAEVEYRPFRVSPEDVDTVQYGSDETKTHRKIYHILGKNHEGMVDKLLLSELFTVGAGGWSGFPPHKHHVDRLPHESNHEEVYLFKFDPPHGFGAQFAYVNDDDYGPVYHIKDNSVIILDKGYHPVVAAPGYAMYYFTILVGVSQRALVQHFHPAHSYQLKTIPGIMDMINKFK